MTVMTVMTVITVMTVMTVMTVKYMMVRGGSKMKNQEADPNHVYQIIHSNQSSDTLIMPIPKIPKITAIIVYNTL